MSALFRSTCTEIVYFPGCGFEGRAMMLFENGFWTWC